MSVHAQNEYRRLPRRSEERRATKPATSSTRYDTSYTSDALLDPVAKLPFVVAKL